MNFRVGKLYQCTSHYLVLYPSSLAIEDCNYVIGIGKKVGGASSRIVILTEEISKRLNYQACFVKPDEIFMVLEVQKRTCTMRVLFLNGNIGWIVDRAWVLYQKVLQ